jgi:hypothetical protein
MKMRKITTGTENFKRFIDEQYYYVDKSMFIKHILSQQVVLFTRPRRFGKTLNMSMLKYFYDMNEKDNAYLFNGLKISTYPEIMKHQNQYPVIFITLKDMKKEDFDSQLYKYSNIIAEVLDDYEELSTSSLLSTRQKILLNKYINLQATQNELEEALYVISQCLYQYYKQKVIILIDEYDVPMQSAYLNNYYDKMSNFISNSFSSALKTNDALERAVLTGCLRIAKESIFTGLNNFKVYSIMNEEGNDLFGFTQEEINELLDYYNCSEYNKTMKEWYNGYIFGGKDIYNPWSALNYVNILLNTTLKQPESFWANTSSNSIVYNYIKNGNEKMKEEFQTLINKESIIKTIKPELTYREMDDINNIYSFLLFTGYLKVKNQVYDTNGEPVYNTYELIIPNKEVEIIYKQQFESYFQDYTKDKKEILLNAFKQEDVLKANHLLNDILFNSISYYDNYESFYHGFLIGLFSDYKVRSNQESGEGRFDVAILSNSPFEINIILECKHSKKRKDLKKDSQEASQQIIEKKYKEGLENDGYDNVKGYGISFYKKACYITKTEY